MWEMLIERNLLYLNPTIQVFVIVWVGSLIVTLNTKLLGGNISFFQSVCVLGQLLYSRSVLVKFGIDFKKESRFVGWFTVRSFKQISSLD